MKKTMRSAALLLMLVVTVTGCGKKNKHEYVDLGLPSGTLWATCNVGATTPEGYGNYYAWGETTKKTTYSWSTYKWSNGSGTTPTKYCNDSDSGHNGFTDDLTELQAVDDAATANWGSGWKTPTSEQWQELKNNTTSTWTTQNSVNGWLLTASNGNSIFLPAAGSRWDDELYDAGSFGLYWSSTLYTSNPINAWRFYFNADDFDLNYYDYRGFGQSVRPVRQN